MNSSIKTNTPEKNIPEKNTHKTVLITGAARRIGRAIAQHFHQENYNIVIHYRHSQTDATQLAESLNTIRPNSARTLQADLDQLKHKDFEQLIHQAVAFWQRLDILINNASSFERSHLGQVTEEQWDRLFASNCKAPFFLSQAAMPYLIKAKGCIINIADIYANKPKQDYAVYCMAKSGLVMQTKALAQELGPDVRVNAIAPGMIMLPEGQNSMDSKEIEQYKQNIALKRMGCAKNIAQAAYFLSQADYTTGHILNIDGGRL